MSPPAVETVQYARILGGIVVIRVTGRGTHQQSPDLRAVFDLTRGDTPPPHYVFDLDQCVTMDSTFMGTMASIAIHQRQRDGSASVATNVYDHVRTLLETLGLSYVMDVRGPKTPNMADNVPASSFAGVPDQTLTRLQQITHMLEAHERLVDIDTRNEVQFQGVLKSLRDSLEREKKRGA